LVFVGTCFRRRKHGTRQVIVLANITAQPRRSIRWQCGDTVGTVPVLEAKGYRFIESGE
jgi:hypothetical protein